MFQWPLAAKTYLTHSIRVVSALRSAGFVLELPLLPRPPKPRQAQLLRHLDELPKNHQFSFLMFATRRFCDTIHRGECIAEGLLDRVAIAFPDLGRFLSRPMGDSSDSMDNMHDAEGTGPIFAPIWDENVPCTYIPPPMPFDTGGVGRAGGSWQCSILQ